MHPAYIYVRRKSCLHSIFMGCIGKVKAAWSTEYRVQLTLVVPLTVVDYMLCTLYADLLYMIMHCLKMRTVLYDVQSIKIYEKLYSMITYNGNASD